MILKKKEEKVGEVLVMATGQDNDHVQRPKPFSPAFFLNVQNPDFVDGSQSR